MLIGYARVSTDEQDTQMQIDALNAVGCDRIFQEHRSGATQNRPELKAAIAALHAGDTLVVWKLDRLARSLRHLIELTMELKEAGIHFRSLTDYIDTSSPAGQFFFHLLGAFAQYERELNAQRVKAGIAARKEAGTYKGFKIPSEKIAEAKALLLENEKWRVVSEKTGIPETRLGDLFPGGKQALGCLQRSSSLTPGQKKVAAELYRQRFSRQHIVAALRVTEYALDKAFPGGFRKNGIIPRAKAPKDYNLSHRQIRRIERLLLRDYGYNEVARRYRISPTKLAEWFPGHGKDQDIPPISDEQWEQARKLLRKDRPWKEVVEKTDIPLQRLRRRFRGGKAALGVAPPPHLSPEQRAEAIHRYEDGQRRREIAREMKVPFDCLLRSFQGGFLAHGVSSPNDPAINPKKGKFSADQLQDMQTRLDAGQSYASVAALYDISDSTVWRWFAGGG